jgi:maleylacetoacetate isomerase/maleylpyruvate isomerase
MIKLYSYFRSSAAYRVRIALNLKRLDHEFAFVDLLEAEEQQAPFTQLNPQKLVPVLEHDGRVFYQSMAILEYLEESFPEPALLPAERAARAEVRALANVVACDIHPLNNTRVMQYLEGPLGADEGPRLAWYRHWIGEGFHAIEARLAATSNGRYCFGNAPGLADVLLIPQVYNAMRFEVDLAPFPTIDGINRHCLDIDAFLRAAPENQPDAN